MLIKTINDPIKILESNHQLREGTDAIDKVSENVREREYLYKGRETKCHKKEGTESERDR